MALDRPSDDDRARREMKWWGWGDPDHVPRLPDRAAAFLRAEIGIAQQPRRPVALDAVRMDEPALPGESRARLAAAVPGNAATASSPAGAVHRTPRTSSSKRP